MLPLLLKFLLLDDLILFGPSLRLHYLLHGGLLEHLLLQLCEFRLVLLVHVLEVLLHA